MRAAASIVYFHHKGVFDEAGPDDATRFARASSPPAGHD